jgi:hypothetical protein
LRINGYPALLSRIFNQLQRKVIVEQTPEMVNGRMDIPELIDLKRISFGQDTL